MYSLNMFGKMFLDAARHTAYAEALRRTVRPGSVVLDIGTGTGVYALLSCQLGARRVYALDVNPCISVARELAAANGFADRIEFMEALSTDVTLPEPADVIVADLRGTLPYFGQNLPSIDDARRRHLAAGGTLIPLRDDVYAALVEAPGAAQAVLGPWLENPLGLDMRAAARMAANSVRSEPVSADQLLTAPQRIDVIDYHDITRTDLHARWTCPVTRAGTAHGLSVWFDATAAEGLTYTTGPDAGPTIYGTGFLPLERPESLQVGDEVELAVHAVLDGDYVFAWSVKVRDPSGVLRTGSSHSTLHGVALSRSTIERRSPSFTITRHDEVQVDLVALQELADGASVGAVADLLQARFPERFPDHVAALNRAADLAGNYAG